MSSLLGRERLSVLRAMRVGRLHPVLGDEPIINLSEANLGPGLSSPRGCLVLTPTRLILAELGLFSFSTVVLPWSHVSAIHLERGIFRASVHLATAGGQVVVTLPPVTRRRWDGPVVHFNQALAGGFFPAATQAPGAGHWRGSRA